MTPFASKTKRKEGGRKTSREKKWAKFLPPPPTSYLSSRMRRKEGGRRKKQPGREEDRPNTFISITTERKEKERPERKITSSSPFPLFWVGGTD